MTSKRVRGSPHYITGLGDGNVNPRQEKSIDEINERSSMIRGRARDALANRDRWEWYYEAQRNRVPEGGENVPWQLSFVALFISMVVLSAAFIFLISDTIDQSRRRRPLKNKRSKPPQIPNNKEKIDMPNPDDDEIVAAKKPVKPSNVYFPDAQKMQEPRLRTALPIPGGSAVSGGSSRKYTTSTSAAAAAAGGINQVAAVTGVGGAVGGGVGGGAGYRSPVPNRATLVIPPSPAPPALALPSDLSPLRPKPSVMERIQLPTLQQHDTTTHRTLNPTIMSNSSSFDSLTNMRTSRHDSDTDSHGGNGVSVYDDEVKNTPARSSFVTTMQSPHPTEGRSAIMFSPPKSSDQRTPARMAKFIKPPSVYVTDQTPKVVNGRRVLPRPPMISQQPSIDESDSGVVATETEFSNVNDNFSDMKFASPPRPNTKPSNNEPPQQVPSPIPYVPSLLNSTAGTPVQQSLLLLPAAEDPSAKGHHPTPPPRSIDIDALGLVMESGNKEHWVAQVEKETKSIHDKILSAGKEEFSSNLKPVASDLSLIAKVLQSASPNAEIPSDDNRNSIAHVRPDLTESTDAASSLQGAIRFSEINLVEVIGGGGFGQVYKGIWRSTPVAVKLLSGSAQSKNVARAVLEEFAAEINLLRGMRHPNICLYMGACVEAPNRAIITELAANGSLWDALRLPLTPPYEACDGVSRTGWPEYLYEPDARYGAPPVLAPYRPPPAVPHVAAWPWALVKRVALGAARGMAYLHAGDPPVLHRDLKSANILLDESYTAKVCDFGLSRIKAQESRMTGNCGTVQWMAPEVLANTKYNEKADVFSYGIICWELLAQRCPYEGMTAIQCALAVLNQNRRPEIPKWCPPPLHALIRSCVKRNPDERPTFPEIIDILDSLP